MNRHVIIIGGGIGGLCLAQGLRKAGISVAVYEKGDRHPQATLMQGYQIHVSAAGSKGLQDCLPEATWDLFSARALEPSAGVQRLTEGLEELSFMRPDIMRGSNPIVRTAFREVLLNGLDDAVHFGKQFVLYDRMPDGQVQATFKDGSSAKADILVGADGLGSKVRAQYLPHARVVDTGLVGMAGKLPVTDLTRSYLPEHLLTRLTGILAPNSLYMVVTESVHKRGGGRTPIAERSTLDPGIDEGDHSIWVLVSSRATYGSDPKSLFADGPALKEIALRLMKDWHPSLRWMVAETDPVVISSTAIQASEPIEPWETTNVTLLGDAIHAMPPLQGLGGSTALRDAALLCRKLVSVEQTNGPLIPAIRDYEAEMLEYGFEAVEASTRMVAMIKGDAPTS